MTPNELAGYQVRQIADAVIKLGLSGEEKERFVREAARLFRYQNDMAHEKNSADDEAVEAEDEWHAACLRNSAAGRAFDEAYDRAQAFLETGKMTGVA